jgi:hypothetical protein
MRCLRSSCLSMGVMAVGSRGVVPGDVMRASDEYNERIGAAGTGLGVDVSSPGNPATVTVGVHGLMTADLYEPFEALKVIGDLIYSYLGNFETRETERLVSGETLVGLLLHVLAIGVFTERHRWEGEGLSVREAQLVGDLRGYLSSARRQAEEGWVREAVRMIDLALARLGAA